MPFLRHCLATSWITVLSLTWYGVSLSYSLLLPSAISCHMPQLPLARSTSSRLEKLSVRYLR